MTLEQGAPIILTILSIVAFFVAGAFWLSRTESTAKNAAKEIDELKNKAFTEMVHRINRLEENKADVKVLSAQMALVLERMAQLSHNVQTLIEEMAFKRGKGE